MKVILKNDAEKIADEIFSNCNFDNCGDSKVVKEIRKNGILFNAIEDDDYYIILTNNNHFWMYKECFEKI